MRDRLVHELNEKLDVELADSSGMVEMMANNIFSSIVTTTKAFGEIKITFDDKTQICFAKVALRWFATSKKLEKLQNYWLVKAERRAKPFVPKGWRLVVYYDRSAL